MSAEEEHRTSADGDASHDETIRDVCVAAHVGAAANDRAGDSCRVENVCATANACEVAYVRRPFHPHHALFISANQKLS